MLMLADTINAVVGGDTHRDTHALEIANPTGTPIATLEIDNDEPGLAQAWPGSRPMLPARTSSSRSRAPAATESAWPESFRLPACR